MANHWITEPRRPTHEATLGFRLDLHAQRTPGPVHDTSWWSVLIGLKDTSLDQFVQTVGPDLARDLLVPDDYTADDRTTPLPLQYVAVHARPALLRALEAGAAMETVVALVPGGVVDAALLGTGAPADPAPDIAVPDGTVLTAVIDDSIGFAHQLFRSGPLRSRVAFANLLAAPVDRADPDAASTHGRVLDRARIDDLLARNTVNGLLDEETFYSDAGLFDAFGGSFSAVALSQSHGTHVMGLAAGYPMSAAPRNRPILCALLPSQVTEDSTGNNLLPSVALALKRMSRQAARFRLPDGRRAPVVFNLSYGNSSGPHDGTGPEAQLFEQFFGVPAPRRDQAGDQTGDHTEDQTGDQTGDQAAAHTGGQPSAQQERRLVLPVGNGNLSRSHARVPCTAGHRVRLDLMLPPDDRTPSFVEHWLPFAGPDPRPLAEVAVTTPAGTTSAPLQVTEDVDQVLRDDAGAEVARLSWRFAPWPTQRAVVTLATRPTAALRPEPLAPAGRWKIDVTPRITLPDAEIGVWIARDETLPGYRPGGRQGYFDNADYQRFDARGAPLPVDPPDSPSPVRRAGTISGLATGDAPMVVAGYAASDRLLADYSAAGPIGGPRGQTPQRAGPDAAALSDASPALPGVLSAGVRSGSMVRLGGTSAAAPRVTRLAVQALAEGRNADRDWLWQLAQDQTPPEFRAPPDRMGGGEVEGAMPFAPPGDGPA